MKTNLFIVHTEYHLLLSIHIATEFYSIPDETNHIYLLKDNQRFKTDTDVTNIDNIYFHDIQSVAKSMETLKKIKCSRLFIFQENSIYNRYLAIYYKKNYKTIISLAPDGFKPYAVFNKSHEFLSTVKDTIKDYKLLFRSKLPLFEFHASEYYRYGSSRFIDEIWLAEPEMFNAKRNKAKGKLIEIPEFSDKSIERAGIYFKVKETDFPIVENGIYYFNQPLWSDLLVNKEFEMLEEILSLHPDKKIISKLHPKTVPSTVERYKSYDRIQIVDSTVPAELFLLQLKNSIVFTGWSTVLLTNNPKCNSYFTWPIYRKLNDRLLSQISTIVEKPHIKMISGVDEMKFPNKL